MNLKNSIFYKNIITLYKLNLNATNEVHRVVIDALFKVFVMTHGDIDQAKLQMCLLTATGQWLNVWGDYFNVPREPGEDDGVYRDRILAETIEPKVTLWALKRASSRWLNRHHGESYTPDDIKIFEPWRQLLKPSQRGTLSGDARLWSRDYWTYAVVDIAIPDASQLSIELIEYLNEVKAAGVKIIWSVKPSWSLITTGWKDDKVVTNYTSIKEIMVKSLYRCFMVFEGSDFIGQDDSYYTGNVLSGDATRFPLSGRQLVWSNMLKRFWNLPIVQHSLRDPMVSKVTHWDDLAKILGLPYEETQLDDIVVFKETEVDNTAYEYWKTLLRTSQWGSLSTEISHLWPFNYNAEQTEPDTPVQFPAYDKLEALERYLGPIEVEHVNLTNHWSNLVLNQRHLEDSSIYKLVKESGCIIPDDGIRKFLYYDAEYTFALWMSLNYLLEQVSRTADDTSLEWLDQHRTEVVDKLLLREDKIDNLLPPIKQTTVNLTNYHINFVNNTRARSGAVYQLAINSGCLLPTSIAQNYVYPDFEKSFVVWMSFEHIAAAVGKPIDEISLEWMDTHRMEVINALIKQEAPVDNIMAPIGITGKAVNLIAFAHSDWVHNSDGSYELTKQVTEVPLAVYKRTDNKTSASKVMVDIEQVEDTVTIKSDDMFDGYILTT